MNTEIKEMAGQASAAPPAKRRWLKRIGVLGFLFFLLKGIAWLVAAWWIVK